MHNANENGAGRDRLAKIVGVNPSCAIDGQIGYPPAIALQKSTWFDDGWMLDRGGDDMIALVAKREEYAFESEVVGFAATAGENDLFVLAVKQCGHLAARLVEGGFCFDRGPMSA